MRSRAAIAFVAFAALFAAPADGQPLFHEYVPNLAADEGTLLVSSGGGTPDAIVYRGELLPPPDPGPLRAGEQPMRADPGDGETVEEPGRRSADFRPDRQTELNGTVGYYTVFNPSIAPFKRVTALDAVRIEGGVPVLGIANRSRQPLRVEGAGIDPPDAPVRDRFWGSVVLDFREGATVPFPSVAPTSRILTLETDPPTPITIARDLAHNYYATAPSETRHSVRVTFLTDAPRSYFGQAIPDGPVNEHQNAVPPMPASVQADALEFASDLGLGRTSTFREALEQLTRHFRSFEESSEPPENTQNIYLDLSRGMRGICRHRAYGFVITAQALGMHARFVQNEAHAWVEVELPSDAGWLRVDLGGAATGLETRGDENRARYQSSPDTLPRPSEYERAYEEASRMSAQREGATGNTEGDGPTPASPVDGPDVARPTPVPEGVDPSRGAVSLVVDRRRYEVFRGRELEVTGYARGDGVGIQGLRVEVVLQAPRGDSESLLGVTVTREHGYFRGVFGVRADLPVGDYVLSVRTPGDERWGGAVAR